MFAISYTDFFAQLSPLKWFLLINLTPFLDWIVSIVWFSQTVSWKKMILISLPWPILVNSTAIMSIFRASQAVDGLVGAVLLLQCVATITQQEREVRTQSNDILLDSVNNNNRLLVSKSHVWICKGYIG
jgi:hypothetical protein